MLVGANDHDIYASIHAAHKNPVMRISSKLGGIELYD